jgi:hypothetical protein
MELRTLVALSLAIPCVASLSEFSPAVIAQSCNTSPTRPTLVMVGRRAVDVVDVEWTVSGACTGERFYLEASRGLSEIIEETADDDSARVATLPLGANNGTPWRMSVRAFNRFGLSAGHSIVLNEGPVIPVENRCPASEIPPPTLVSVQAFGRTVMVQWEADPRCPLATTGFVIGGSESPGGPLLGSVDVPYPNARSWSGEVPPGSYYVSVYARYYSSSSVASNTMLVHVQ